MRTCVSSIIAGRTLKTTLKFLTKILCKNMDDSPLIHQSAYFSLSAYSQLSVLVAAHTYGMRQNKVNVL